MNSRGVVLFAHNTQTVNYYNLAARAADRVRRFLKLPVTVITDVDSDSQNSVFDRTIVIEADKSNFFHKKAWYNKGRYQVYDLSPYDETLVLDSDYVVNSSQLLRTFDSQTDFACHKKHHYLLEQVEPERLGTYGPEIAWATVMMFRRTNRTRQLFDVIRMVQENYDHYAQIYKFMPYSYRNDYALTIALRVVNGQIELPSDYIPWNLLHIGNAVTAHRISDTEYLFLKPHKPRTQYTILTNTDFHMMNKNNFLEIIQ